MRTILLSSIICLIASLSIAEINTLEGSYEITDSDKIVLGTSSFAILRSYSSRSNFIGLFGQGWCSELDWQWNFKKRVIIKCDKEEPLNENSQRKYFFNRSGKLIKIYQDNIKVDVVYKKFLPQELRINSVRLVLNYSPDFDFITKIQKIQPSADLYSKDQDIAWKAKYFGRQLERVQVLSNKKLIHIRYEYDEDNNMTNYQRQDSSQKIISETMQYDSSKDLLMRVNNSLCEITLQYKWNPIEFKQITQTHYNCNFHPVLNKTVLNEFKFKKEEGGLVL